MITPKKLTRKTIEQAPYEIWNAFVQIVFSPYDQLDEVQRIAHHAMWYDSELNNGGHLQYFENHGTDRIDEILNALHVIGADSHARILKQATARRASKSRTSIETVGEYVAIALQGEYNDLDAAFYQCKPEIGELLQAFLAANERFFVERVD